MPPKISENSPPIKAPLPEQSLLPANDNRSGAAGNANIIATDFRISDSKLHIGHQFFNINNQANRHEWEGRLRTWLKLASSPEDFDHLDDMLDSLKNGCSDVQAQRKSPVSIRNRSPLPENARQNSWANDTVEDARLGISGLKIHRGNKHSQSSISATSEQARLKTLLTTPGISSGIHSSQHSNSRSVPLSGPRSVPLSFPRSGQHSSQSDWMMKLEKEIMDVKKVREADCIRQWLGPPQSPDLYETTRRMKVHNTCNWILTTPTFLQWASPDFTPNNAKTLWIYSLSGFGKTVLCAGIVEYLKASFNTPVGYFFLSSKNESYRDPFIAMHAWLLKILQHNSVIQAMRQVWKSQSKETISRSITIELFRTIVQQVPGCTFVLDGLDECGSAPTTHLQTGDEIIQDFLTELWKAVHQTKTRILLVSQDDQTIRSNIPTKEMVLSEHRITREDVDADIILYAQSILEKKISKETSQNKEKIAKLMRDRCDGQFEWLRSIQRSLPQQPTLRELEETIAEAPRGLEKLYERNWKRIFALRGKNVARAIDTLRWVAFSLRPLTVQEIANALMIDLKSHEISINNVPNKIDGAFATELEDICAGLLEVRSHENDAAAKWTVHLQHHSVKEFLLQATVSTKGTRWERVTKISSRVNKENAKLARLCLHYLNYESTWEDTSAIDKTDLSPFTQAFRTYASTYWHQHLIGIEKTNERSTKLINHFFDMGNSAWDAWENWSSANEQVLKYEKKTPNGNRLHYACQLDLSVTARNLLHQQASILETRTPSGATCLWIACAAGNSYIVEMLLATNANPTAKNEAKYTPLDIASENGHVDVVKALLTTKAAASHDGWCLCIAAESGYYEVVRLLLKSGADVSTKVYSGKPALNLAAEFGHLKVVRLLLDHDALVSATDDEGVTPLHCASLRCHTEIAELLFQKGADANAMDVIGDTALHYSSTFGLNDMVGLLIKYGADVNAQNSNGETPLFCAAQEGHPQTVQLLLENKSRSDIATYKDKFTPIYVASSNGYEQIVHLLLQYKADVDICTVRGVTPLQAASANEHYDTIEQLFKYKADASQTDQQGRTSLHHAAFNGNADIARLLIEHGADKNVMDLHNDSPLSVALGFNNTDFICALFDSCGEMEFKQSERQPALLVATANGYLSLVRRLIELGTDLSIKDAQGMTLLNLAMNHSQIEIAGLLVEHGADVTAVNDKGWTLLHHAAYHQDISKMRFLLQNGANINATNNDGWTPIYTCIAAGNASTEALYFLISHKADITIADNEGWTPVHVAIENCDMDTLLLLIAAGVNITPVTVDGASSILLASPIATAQLLQLLLDQGADASQPDAQGNTPLMTASRCGNSAAVRWLLTAAPSVTGELDVFRRSAFFYATARGHDSIAEVLFAANSDVVAIKDVTGITALERAARHGHNEVVREIAAMASTDQISVAIPELNLEDVQPVRFDFAKSYCDVCIQDIPLENTCYKCSICMSGNFNICEECCQNNDTCLDSTHHLEVVEPERSSDAESNGRSDSEQK